MIPILINNKTGEKVNLGDEVFSLCGKKYVLKGILKNENKDNVWYIWLKNDLGSFDRFPGFIGCRFDYENTNVEN